MKMKMKISEEAREISRLQKQTKEVEKLLLENNIKFTKLNIAHVDPETELLLLQNHYKYMKNLLKLNQNKDCP